MGWDGMGRDQTVVGTYVEPRFVKEDVVAFMVRLQQLACLLRCLVADPLDVEHGLLRRGHGEVHFRRSRARHAWLACMCTHCPCRVGGVMSRQQRCAWLPPCLAKWKSPCYTGPLAKHWVSWSCVTPLAVDGESDDATAHGGTADGDVVGVNGYTVPDGPMT
jgi:hypothetical protein